MYDSLFGIRLWVMAIQQCPPQFCAITLEILHKHVNVCGYCQSSSLYGGSSMRNGLSLR